MKIPVKRLNEKAVMPQYGSDGAAAMDLFSTEEHTITPGETQFVSTGIAMAIPEGYVGLIFARSGLSCKQDLAPANKVGVIDSDYRGEIKVALHNHGKQDRTIEVGQRVAQMAIVPVVQASLSWVDDLDDTNRGEGGFGSTGS